MLIIAQINIKIQKIWEGGRKMGRKKQKKLFFRIFWWVIEGACALAITGITLVFYTGGHPHDWLWAIMGTAGFLLLVREFFAEVSKKKPAPHCNWLPGRDVHGLPIAAKMHAGVTAPVCIYEETGRMYSLMPNMPVYSEKEELI